MNQYHVKVEFDIRTVGSAEVVRRLTELVILDELPQLVTSRSIEIVVTPVQPDDE